MQTEISKFDDKGAVLIGISTSTAGEVKDKMLPKGFTFPLLADPELKVIDAFGLRHVAGYPTGGDVSRPAVIIVDEKGNIQEKLLTDNWRVRPTAEELLSRL